MLNEVEKVGCSSKLATWRASSIAKGSGLIFWFQICLTMARVVCNYVYGKCRMPHYGLYMIVWRTKMRKLRLGDL